jgi:hypothetical protein
MTKNDEKWTKMCVFDEKVVFLMKLQCTKCPNLRTKWTYVLKPYMCNSGVQYNTGSKYDVNSPKWSICLFW